MPSYAAMHSSHILKSTFSTDNTTVVGFLLKYASYACMLSPSFAEKIIIIDAQ